MHTTTAIHHSSPPTTTVATFNYKPLSLQARDLVESAVKPGASSLQILAALAPLVRKLGPAADPASLKKLPVAAAAVWLFYAGACTAPAELTL